MLALNQVSFSIRPGEIHALMGENGAGKSTLIKVISGAIEADSGSIIIDGEEYEKLNPMISQRAGVGVVYQEFNMVSSLSVMENIFLGDHIGSKYLPDFKKMRLIAESVLKELGADIKVDQMVGNLSVAQQQVVEIAKSIYKNVKVLIMDEPSAALSKVEAENMLKMVKRLKEKGIAVIYISHRLEEIFEIADRVSVMRDGAYIGTEDISDLTRKKLITMMVGRELNESFPERNSYSNEIVFEGKHLEGNGDHDISFQLHKGEILGLAGLMGAGRTELAKLLIGAEKLESGELYLNGKKVRIRSPKEAVKNGIGLIPENRKTEGAFLEFPIDWNITIMSLRQLSSYGSISEHKIEEVSKKYASALHIKTPHLKQLVKNLSGGNQQKVVVAKVLAANTKIIIFDEPTRGIDVGAKQEIYELMNELVMQGVSIIMISSEMEELIGMSDRILVLCHGRLAGEISKNEFDQNKILEMAAGL